MAHRTDFNNYTDSIFEANSISSQFRSFIDHLNASLYNSSELTIVQHSLFFRSNISALEVAFRRYFSAKFPFVDSWLVDISPDSEVHMPGGSQTQTDTDMSGSSHLSAINEKVKQVAIRKQLEFIELVHERVNADDFTVAAVSDLLLTKMAELRVADQFGWQVALRDVDQPIADLMKIGYTHEQAVAKVDETLNPVSTGRPPYQGPTNKKARKQTKKNKGKAVASSNK